MQGWSNACAKSLTHRTRKEIAPKSITDAQRHRRRFSKQKQNTIRKPQPSDRAPRALPDQFWPHRITPSVATQSRAHHDSSESRDASPSRRCHKTSPSRDNRRISATSGQHPTAARGNKCCRPATAPALDSEVIWAGEHANAVALQTAKPPAQGKTGTGTCMRSVARHAYLAPETSVAAMLRNGGSHRRATGRNRNGISLAVCPVHRAVWLNRPRNAEQKCQQGGNS